MENEKVQADRFQELYAPCQRRLYTYIVMLVGEPMAAQDILSDANLVLWQKFDHFQPGTDFFAWAREVARFSVLRYRRIHAGDIMLLDPAILDDLERVLTDQVSDDAYAEALRGCLKKLSEGDADVILRRYSGLSVKLLAKQLARSENAISQALGRVRRALRLCIERTIATQGSEA